MEIYEQYIKSHLSYDAQTGIVSWSRKNGGRAPLVAGNVDNKYRRIKCKGKKFLAHRIAWFLHFGVWPEGQIDHINGDKLDNRLANLRDVDQFANQQNVGKRQNGWRPNTSGWKGVSWNKKGQIWQAEIRHNGDHTFLGSFTDIKEAAEEYIFAALKLHGDYARLE